tara:strand:+ start:2872 stop:3960 length:1089 start_codon:yes stop_codon:yes gene_type:complete
MSAQQESFDYRMPPGEITGPSAWYGTDLAARSQEWIRPFSGSELDELDAAMRGVKERGLEIVDIERDDFPLPTLGPALDEVRQDVLRGRGFALLRGLPVDHYSIEESAIIYFGLGAHMGVAISQNMKGHVLGHVKDLGRHEFDPNSRIYQTTARQQFHTDTCDIAALLCLQPAKSGGKSAIVSAATLYNEIRRRRPDLLPVLFQPFSTDWRGDAPLDSVGHYALPILSWHAGLLYCRYVRRYIESARRFDDVLPLTDQEIEALDLFDELSDDPQIHLKMEFRQGDIQFLHNHQTLHDRTEYEDWDEPEKKRHLLRLWLNCRDGWPLPESFLPRFFTLEIGSPGRGGYLLPPGCSLNAPLEAE